MPPGPDHHLVGVRIRRCGDGLHDGTRDGLRRQELGGVVLAALVGHQQHHDAQALGLSSLAHGFRQRVGILVVRAIGLMVDVVELPHAGGTTRAHLARATLEAIAYQVRDVAELMVTDAGMPINQLAIDGGAAINNLLCQMQADALQSPVNRSAELQTTGLGAAFLAGLGAGLWESTAELASSRQTSGVFAPAACDTGALKRWHDAVQRSLHWSDR